MNNLKFENEILSKLFKDKNITDISFNGDNLTVKGTSFKYKVVPTLDSTKTSTFSKSLPHLSTLYSGHKPGSKTLNFKI